MGGVSIIAGTMIGSGIFASPGLMLLYTGDVWLSLLAWLAAGTFTLRREYFEDVTQNSCFIR